MKTAINRRAAIWALALAVGTTVGAVAPAGPATWPIHALTLDPVAADRVQPGVAAETYTLAPDGNEARYRVRERLAGRDLDNDAIGVTKAITGRIAFDDAGAIVRDSSKFTIDLATLKTDSDRRDGYVRRNTLEVETFPTAVFVPFQMLGLDAGVPATGSFSFQLVGELTLHGVSRVITWNVTAQAADDTYTGAAVTQFQFADFQMKQPRVPIVLSVKDTIQLEYDFKLVKAR